MVHETRTDAPTADQKPRLAFRANVVACGVSCEWLFVEEGEVSAKEFFSRLPDLLESGDVHLYLAVRDVPEGLCDTLGLDKIRARPARIFLVCNYGRGESSDADIRRLLDAGAAVHDSPRLQGSVYALCLPDPDAPWDKYASMDYAHCGYLTATDLRVIDMESDLSPGFDDPRMHRDILEFIERHRSIHGAPINPGPLA